MGGVRDDRVGRVVRALRTRNGWRQSDLAARAGVSQRLIAELELGRLDGVTVGRIRRVGAALEVIVDMEAWWRRGDVDRLMDRGHAAIVECVMRRLTAGGWVTLAEVTFNHYGERGSVDIVAWHPPTGTLLLIEVKTRIGDVQALHSTFARKVRIVPGVLERERGWVPRRVTGMLVVPATHGSRDVVRRHATTFDSMWPERSAACQRLIDRPDDAGDVPGGIWFLDRAALGRGASALDGTVRRVRVRERGDRGRS